MKPEEGYAAKAFADWLAATGFRFEWRPFEPDPPDLEFLVQNCGVTHRWGVEVTGLVPTVKWGDDTKSLMYLQRTLEQMCSRLQQQINPAMGLSYTIFATGPFRPKWKFLMKRAAEYIASGRTDSCPLDIDEYTNELGSILDDSAPDGAAQAIEAWASQQARCHIKADPGPPTIIPLSMLEGTAKTPAGSMVADIMARLNDDIQMILDAKLPRLRRVEHQFDRKLLLIWTDDMFADHDRIGKIVMSKGIDDPDLDGIALIDSASKVGWVSDPRRIFRP